MDRSLRHRIRSRLSGLQSENGETLFEQLCGEVARRRIHANIQMASFVAGHGDKGRDFENVPGHHKNLVGSRGQEDGLKPDDSLVGACTLGRSDVLRKIRGDVATIHDEGPKPDHIYHFCETDFPTAQQVDLRNWCKRTYGTRLHILTGKTLADWLSAPDLQSVASGLLEVASIPDPVCPLHPSCPDIARDCVQPVGCAAPYASISQDRSGQSLTAFADVPAVASILEQLNPFRARLVRQALSVSDIEAVTTVWNSLPVPDQVALAILDLAVLCARRKLLEDLIPECNWSELLPPLERDKLVFKTDGGFYRVDSALREQIVAAADLHRQAREHWLHALQEYEGFWDLDCERCLHLWKIDAYGEIVEIAHRTILVLEDPLALELYGTLLSAVDTKRKVLSAHHRLLIDNAIGVRAVHLGNYREAQSRFERMLKQARRAGDDWAIVEALLHLGLTAYFGGQQERAASYYRRTIDEARRRDQPLLLGRALNNLAQCLIPQDPEQARALLAESIAVREKIGDESPVAEWMSSGLLAIECSDAATALKCFKKAEAAVGTDGYLTDRARTLHNQANALNELGRAEEAIHKGSEALELARHLESPELLRLTVQGQAVRLAQHGDNRTALPLFHELVRLKGDIGDRPGKAVALSDAGVMSLRIGERDAALGLFVEAQSVAEAAEAETQIGWALRNHAWALRDGGDGDSATSLLSREYQRAWDQARWTLATDLAKELADQAFRIAGPIEETDAWMRKAIDAARKGKDRHREFDLMGQRFACLRDRDRPDKALSVVQDLANATRGRKGFAARHAAACADLGNHCAERGESEEAQRHYRLGLKALEREPDPKQQALLLGNLGELDRRCNRFDAAEKHIREALSLIEPADWESRLHSMHNLALVLDQSGKSEEAVGMLNAIRDRSKARGDWQANANAWLELGSIAWQQERSGLAIHRWERALNVAQTQGLARSETLAAYNLARAFLDRQEPELAIRVLTGRRNDPPNNLSAQITIIHTEALRRLGRLDQAAELLVQRLAVVQGRADEVRLRSTSATVLSAQGRLDDAWAEWERTCALAETHEEREQVYRDALDLLFEQEPGSLYTDERLESLFSRIQQDPNGSLARDLMYRLADRLWNRDPDSACVIYYAAMFRTLIDEGFEEYIADGFRLVVQVARHPQASALEESVRQRVSFVGHQSDGIAPIEEFLWPFRMAERYQPPPKLDVKQRAEQLGILFQQVWAEIAHG